MAYPGLAFAILVGVAIGTALYCYFNQEDNQQQQQQGYQYHQRDNTTDSTYDPWTNSRSSSCSGSIRSDSSRRRRRNSASKCSICLDDLSRGSVKTLENCGHEFHAHCVSTWLKQEKTCPNCRSSVFL